MGSSQTTPQSLFLSLFLLHLLFDTLLAGVFITYSLFYQYLCIIPESFFPVTLFLNSWDCVAKLLTWVTWVSVHPFTVYQTLVLTTASNYIITSQSSLPANFSPHLWEIFTNNICTSSIILTMASEYLFDPLFQWNA